jgi:hypothetical protein
MRPPLPALAGVTAALIAAGCGTVSLREAMDRVQRRHKDLSEALESGSSMTSRDAAIELRNALLAPAIQSTSPNARDPEFQRLLAEAVASTDRVRTVARSFDALAIGKLRAEVSATCDACHAKYRTER